MAPRARKRSLPLSRIARIGTVVVAAAVLCSILLAGCAPAAQPAQGGTQAAAPADAQFPFTFTDDMGRQVTLPAPPVRLVSLSPGNTEILFALGLGPKVVGVDEYSDYPPEAAQVAKIGSFSQPSVEKVVALKPDLVLATDMHEQAVRQLEDLGIPVAVVLPRTVDQVMRSIAWVGRAAGVKDKADQLAAEMQARIAKVKTRVENIPQEERPRVYYEVYSDPLMSAGPKTFIGQLIVLAGGRNIAQDADTDYPKFSAEAIIKRNPQVMIFPQFHGTAALTVEQIKARRGWAQVSAVKDSRLYGIDADLISRPGPRVAEALEELARLIHPELFAK
ncbi:ABC transporter substrate-binding protein [Gelria sp. Kuro-4]|uniref:ABC transporter substrate-binding protein n=1 Tax=Gelria sp. Kuro-4 TaxID=2796927 RepID=UPI001BF03E0F|nr:ABC transporter substrate-binding protein [Gelria sp. Kuro-4]BCV23893.1 ABC transporter substrate-binding protein [Gelria sp. Kuro-4]